MRGLRELSHVLLVSRSYRSARASAWFVRVNPETLVLILSESEAPTAPSRPPKQGVVSRRREPGTAEASSGQRRLRCGVQGLGQLAEQAGDAWGEGVADLGSAPTGTNDSVGAQRLQVSRDCGLADAEVLGEVTRADPALDRQAPGDASRVGSRGDRNRAFSETGWLVCC